MEEPHSSKGPADSKLETNPPAATGDSRNAKEEHKSIDSHKSATAPASDDKLKELQNKIAFYEREHEGFQNKLLSQRQSYEQ